MEHDFYNEPPARPAYRCGGWASHYGPCGATDCGSCHPGGAEEEESKPETVRDLSTSGYDFDDGDGTWSRIICLKQHTARRDHKDGRIKKGDTYRKMTTRHVNDETGETWLYHYKCLLQRGDA